MKELVVGDKNCSISNIVCAIHKSNCLRQVTEEWRKLARALDAPNEMIYIREQDLLLQRKNALDIVSDLLLDWRSRLGHGAKFEHFLDILEHQCGWKAISDNLWNTFRAYMTDDITWAHLDMRSRNRIMESQEEFQGQRKSLKSICSYFFDTELEKILETTLSGSTILKLLRGQHMVLLNESIPETLFFYTTRVLTSRRRINPEIFKIKCSDIFVIEGISLFELSGIADRECIAKCSNQQEKLTSRFIQLDFQDGFQVIKKISKCAPVHHLNFKDGNFYWVKSSGHLSLLQEYIHNEQDSVPEEKFLFVLQQEYNKNLPVCIADIPGMGKTCLIANIARQRQINAGDETLVLFVVLSKFLNDIENIRQQVVCEANVCYWIAKHVSQSELGLEIVAKMMRSEFHRVEIYFDGYDELPGYKQKFTISIIKCLGDHFKYVHTAITTRTHKMHQLEQSLQVLSFNIESLQHHDQVHLFEQFWSKQHGISLNANLQRFANFVAGKIREALPSTECDVVGIPLQCSMLADILANDALKYSKDSSLPLQVCLDINSVHDMYSALMTKRFEACYGDEQIKMIYYHGVAALQAVLLPESFPDLVLDKVGLQTKDVSKINTLGILIIERNCNLVQFKFAHHSYAEYIVANILVNDLVNTTSSWEKLFGSVSAEDLLLDAMSLTVDDPIVPVGTGECTFDNLWKRICNSENAEKLRTNWEKLAYKLNLSKIDLAEIRENLKFNQSRGEFEMFQDPLYLLLVQWTKTLETQPKLCHLLDALRALDFCIVAENLKSAYGNPTFKNKNLCFFIDGILQEKKSICALKLYKHVHLNDLNYFKDILTASLHHNFYNLFALISHHCLSIKCKQPGLFRGIFWSHLIIDAVKCSTLNLVVKCCDFVESMEECKLGELERFKMTECVIDTTLHAAVKRGDFTIFDFLIKKFRPCEQKIKYLLHFCARYSLSNSDKVISEKIQIIQLITNTNKHFLNEKENDIYRRTPILMPCVHLQLLEFMIDMGADIKAVDEAGETVAHIATRYLSTSDYHTFVEYLLKKGATEILLMRDNKYKSTPVNIAAACIDLKPETVQLLSAQVGNRCFHSPDWEGDDVLFYAVAGLRKRATLQILVECGGDPKRLRKDRQTILHTAAVYGNIDAMSYFVSLGCSVNARDVSGCTPLHLAILLGTRNVDATVRILLDLNVKADIKDISGHKAIWYAESEDKFWMLEPDTRNTLMKASEENHIWSKLWEAVRFQP